MVDPATPPAGKPSAKASATPSSGEFELRHWRSNSSLRRRAAPGITLTIDLPSPPSPAVNGDLHRCPAESSGYISLRDLLGSPSSSASFGAPSTPSATDATQIRIRNPLVKQAAYAYLQPTPSATETTSHRRRGAAAAIWRACASCFGFLGRLLRGLRR